MQSRQKERRKRKQKGVGIVSFSQSLNLLIKYYCAHLHPKVEHNEIELYCTKNIKLRLLICVQLQLENLK